MNMFQTDSFARGADERLPLRVSDRPRKKRFLALTLSLFSVIALAACSEGFPGNGYNDYLLMNSLGGGSAAPQASPGINITTSGGLFTTEAGGTASFDVVLLSRPSAQVDIPLLSSNALEGTVSPSNLTFDSSNWNIPQTVVLTGADDAVNDGNQTFTVITDPAVSADPNYSSLNGPDVAILNIDDDQPLGLAQIVAGPVSGLTTSENGDSVQFTVNMFAAPVDNVKICLTLDDPGEASVSGADLTIPDAACPVGSLGSLNFTAADWQNARTVTVTGVNDDLKDLAQPFQISFTGDATTTDAKYVGIAPLPVSGTNLDNDTPNLIYTSPAAISETGTVQTFTVRLASEPLGNVNVDVQSLLPSEGLVSLNGTTFSAGPLTMVFTGGTSGNWNTDQTVYVRGVDDLVADGNRTFNVSLAPSSVADADYNTLGVQNVSVTNTDNETPGLNISSVSLTLTEGGLSGSFQVSLNSAPQTATTVKLCLDVNDTTAATIAIGGQVLGPDADCPTARLEFTAATAKTVNINPTDDFVADGTQNFTVSVVPKNGTDPIYNAVSPIAAAGTTADNETGGAGPSVVFLPIAGLATDENGGQDFFTVRLNTQPTATVKVCLRADDATEVQLVTGAGHYVSAEADCVLAGYSGALIFDATNWATPQLAYVQGLSDGSGDGNIAFNIQTAVLSTDANYSGIITAGTSVVSGTNADNGHTYLLSSNPVVGTTTVFAGGCTLDGSPSDDIYSVQIKPYSSTQIEITVYFFPEDNCPLCFTTVDGVAIKLALYDSVNTTYTNIRQFVLGPPMLNLNQTNVVTEVYTLPALPAGTHYIRAMLIDRASNTDAVTAAATCATTSSGTAGGGSRDFDNADAAFTIP